MGIMRILAAAVLGLALAACDTPAQFAAPLPGAASYDPRLVGAWGMLGGERNQASAGLLALAPAEDGGLEARWSFTHVDPAASGGATFVTTAWQARAAELDGTVYFSGRVTGRTMFAATAKAEAGDLLDIERELLQSEPVYEIGRAELISDDLLAVSFVAESAVENLAFLRRTVGCSEGCALEIHDLSSDQLAALIRERGGDAMFSRTANFIRLEGNFPQQPRDGAQ